MFGVKIRKLKLKDTYTTEQLYEKIAGIRFEAGTPELVKYGPVYVIAFPEIDRNNQVQIQADSKGKIFVQRAVTPIGLEKQLRNEMLDDLTCGLSSMSMVFGKKKKLCMALVDKTADQLEAMGLDSSTVAILILSP